MQSRRIAAGLALAAAGAALAFPGSAGAGMPSCVGQAASAPTMYPTEKADFVTFFSGPGYGQFVAAYAHAPRAACPPLPTPG